MSNIYLYFFMGKRMRYLWLSHWTYFNLVCQCLIAFLRNRFTRNMFWIFLITVKIIFPPIVYIKKWNNLWQISLNGRNQCIFLYLYVPWVSINVYYSSCIFVLKYFFFIRNRMSRSFLYIKKLKWLPYDITSFRWLRSNDSHQQVSKKTVSWEIPRNDVMSF